jgi:hypothetical protein
MAPPVGLGDVSEIRQLTESLTVAGLWVMTDYRPDYHPQPPPVAWQAPAVAPWQTPPPPAGSLPARRRRRVLVVAAAVAVVLVAGLGIGLTVGLLTRGGPASTSPGNSSTTSSAAAKALYNQTLAATRGSAGVHYVSVSTGASVTQKTVGDATQDGGGQLITLNSTYGNEQFTLRLVNGTVYFQGNSPAVEDQLGVPAAGAAGVQGKWVSVTSSDGPYSVLQPGITVAEQANELAMVPKSTSQVTAADGTKATRITGTITSPQGDSGTGHLDVAAGSHLPISQASTVSAGGITTTTTVTFSGWGTAVPATAPASSVAWSTLGASTPPGGFGSGGNSQSPSSTPSV